MGSWNRQEPSRIQPASDRQGEISMGGGGVRIDELTRIQPASDSKGISMGGVRIDKSCKDTTLIRQAG